MNVPKSETVRAAWLFTCIFWFGWCGERQSLKQTPMQDQRVLLRDKGKSLHTFFCPAEKESVVVEDFYKDISHV